MKLHKIVNDLPAPLFCGPAAVCIITGASASRVVELLKQERETRRWRSGNDRRPVIKGTVVPWELDPALKRLGYELSRGASEPTSSGGAGGHLRLADWLEHPLRARTTTYLVTIRVPNATRAGAAQNHVLVVRGRRGGDNHTGAPVPLAKLPFLGEEVLMAHEVTPLRGGDDATAQAVKDARRRLGLSALQLAEALRLGKGGDRTVRRWESAASAVPGPAQVAIELLLEKRVELERRSRGDKIGKPDCVLLR